MLRGVWGVIEIFPFLVHYHEPFTRITIIVKMAKKLIVVNRHVGKRKAIKTPNIPSEEDSNDKRLLKNKFIKQTHGFFVSAACFFFMT